MEDKRHGDSTDNKNMNRVIEVPVRTVKDKHARQAKVDITVMDHGVSKGQGGVQPLIDWSAQDITQ